MSYFHSLLFIAIFKAVYSVRSLSPPIPPKAQEGVISEVSNPPQSPPKKPERKSQSSTKSPSILLPPSDQSQSSSKAVTATSPLSNITIPTSPNISPNTKIPITKKQEEEFFMYCTVGNVHGLKSLYFIATAVLLQDKDGNNGLLIAARENKVEICMYLLDYGSNVNLTNKVKANPPPSPPHIY